jgi:glycine hydroxymethyltransferase
MSKTIDFMNLVQQHEEYRIKSCINLRADENYASTQIRSVLGSDLCNRNTSPDPRYIYRGTKYLNEVGNLTIELGKKLFKADYINIWAPTGQTANIITFFSFCKPGDKVLVVSPENGGYGGMARDNLPKYLGLETLYFPFNEEKMNIDVETERTAKLISSEQPTLIVFGATTFLFPHPVLEVSKVAHRFGIPVAYDGAHVLGLIAGGQFQDPLREGADILFGSTMKTLGGPPGGVLLTNSKEIYEKTIKATPYNAVTNKQWNRVASLGIRFAEMLENGKEYAAQVVRNAKVLAESLDKKGIGIMCKDEDYTASHMILMDVGGFLNNIAANASKTAAKLEEAHIIIDDRGRLGVAEVTRIGMKGKEMEAIADLIAKVLVHKVPPEKVRIEVRQLRSRFEINTLNN